MKIIEDICNYLNCQPEDVMIMEQENVIHFQCFDYMLDCADDILTENIIKKFHAILKADTSDSHLGWFSIGEYKRCPNMVGVLRQYCWVNKKKKCSGFCLNIIKKTI